MPRVRVRVRVCVYVCVCTNACMYGCMHRQKASSPVSLPVQDNHEYTAVPANTPREDTYECVCVRAGQLLNNPVSNKYPCSSWMVFGFLFVVSNQDPYSPFLSPSLSLGLSLYAVVKSYALRLHCLSLSLLSRFQSLPRSLSFSVCLCTNMKSTMHLRIFSTHDIHDIRLSIQTYVTSRFQ